MTNRNEPLAAIKSRRNATLSALFAGVPYIRWLGIRFDRRGDELTAILPFDGKLIGNPMLPALHGGVTAAFLEVAAIVELTWSAIWEDMEAGRIAPDPARPETMPHLPKTIDFTVDYLRPGLGASFSASAEVTRLGGRLGSTQMRMFSDSGELIATGAAAYVVA